MARATGPKCRLCRREGAKLFLKGSRCDSPKCSLGKRDYPPGQISWRGKKISDYGLQLREKQKLKRFYGVLEKQFRRYFNAARESRGNTGQVLLQLLERRLDNAVFKLGFAASRPEARQLVNHGHILINERKVDIASYSVEVGEAVGVFPKEQSQKLVRGKLQGSKGRPLPSWLAFDESKLEGKVTALPSREEVSVDVQEQLVVELCSR